MQLDVDTRQVLVELISTFVAIAILLASSPIVALSSLHQSQNNRRELISAEARNLTSSDVIEAPRHASTTPNRSSQSHLLDTHIALTADSVRDDVFSLENGHEASGIDERLAPIRIRARSLLMDRSLSI